MFNGWARRSRCGLNFNLPQVLTDEAWEVVRTKQVTAGVNGAQRSLVRICQGAYLIPGALPCDCAFVEDQLAASFVAAAASFLYRVLISKGRYSDTVSGRTTCAPCKAEWTSVALMLTSACTVVVGYSRAFWALPTC